MDWTAFTLSGLFCTAIGLFLLLGREIMLYAHKRLWVSLLITPLLILNIATWVGLAAPHMK